MHNLRSYYYTKISKFLWQSNQEILGVIDSNDISAEMTIQQSSTWKIAIEILKE